ncbi:MAG: hypothetical protein LBL66_09760 [Clostridiales bacterium]|jgi:hypothetical protein|nr:hypothetical protein [Clostridiales bacterium]
MRILKIYLETTIFNFVFAEDAPDKRLDTLRLFEEIKAGIYAPYTSDYVVGELMKETTDKREKMLSLINEYGIKRIAVDPEAERLAGLYVAGGIIPEKFKTDGNHIAIATVSNLDIIVSWNFRHIVKMKTIFNTAVINVSQGYKKVEIFSPSEVIEYD